MKQKNNNVNPFNYPAKKYSSYVFDATTKYQKKYGFEMGTGSHATWNNEADAFKHTYMQAQLALFAGKHIAKFAGDYHEMQGNKDMGQSKGEENMDKWNNAQGCEIAKEIIQEYGVWATAPSQKINDVIARKVMERMKSGKLITNPDDKRVYKEGDVTGNAAPIDSAYTKEQIGKMSPEEFVQNESIIMEQLKNGQIKSDFLNIDYSNFINPESGENKIFTRENISEMSSKEYLDNEKAILAQMNTIGVPYDKDVPNRVNTYSKEKKTKNSSSNSKTKSANSSSVTSDGKWVTINGNHVLIEK